MIVNVVLLIGVLIQLARTAVTTNYLTMIYLNRTLYDGENVLVSANLEETRKEAVVTCVARQIDPEQSLVFQFHAQNSILLEPKDNSWLENHNMEGFTIGRRRIMLENGGFLKLQCAITNRDPNQTPSVVSPPRLWPIPNAVSLTSSTKRPVIPPPVMHINNNNSTANTLHITLCAVITHVSNQIFFLCILHMRMGILENLIMTENS
uniref:Ig-like domain-containing protein n=1 Tax=Strigamia maritima TaxID=126957 RepID=T1J2G0_STRMM